MTTSGATIQVRPKSSGDYEGMMDLARSLGSWFNQESLVLMAVDLKEDPAWVALEGTRVVGFLAYQKGSTRLRSITWMGIAVAMQRHGIGSALLNRFLEECYDEDVGEVRVWAQFEGEGDVYRAARSFYRSRGFRDDGREENFYGPGKDRLQFILDMSEL